MTRKREKWRDVPGYEGRYQASDQGRLRSKERGLLSPFLSTGGYLVATVRKDGKRYGTGAHRLIAEAWVPNPESKPEINHKNGVRTDNRPENLEWVTRSENNLHRRRVLQGGGGRPKRPVRNLDTGVVYPSITDAAAATGAQLAKIVACCRGQRQKTNGQRWAYETEGKPCAR
jgi:hypothetical protein